MLSALDKLKRLRAGLPDNIEEVRRDPEGPPKRNAAESFHRPASIVLQLVTQSEVPQSHTALTHALQEAGHTKDAAREAIAEAQGRGWIEHDLKRGYVLAGDAPEGGEECNGS